MSKSSATYQQLQTIMAEPGCPICAHGLQAARAYLDSLLWESVNDAGIRESLVASLGFCGRHSRELLTFSGERVGVAILQRAALQAAVSRLEQSPPPAQPTLIQRFQDTFAGPERPASEAGPSPSSQQSCPACIHQDQAEARGLETLLAHLVGDLDEPLRSAGGLCRPHLQQALQSEREPRVRGILTQLHRQVWDEIIAQLGEFIRKNDHRFHAEKIIEPERAAVERSIAILTGEYSRS